MPLRKSYTGSRTASAIAAHNRSESITYPVGERGFTQIAATDALQSTEILKPLLTNNLYTCGLRKIRVKSRTTISASEKNGTFISAFAMASVKAPAKKTARAPEPEGHL
ncbi:MAG: hypothetical protein IKN37_07630 [Bacteroidales bacterium]|nr:hypothetical protein [Bacteroidales bacterium]